VGKRRLGAVPTDRVSSVAEGLWWARHRPRAFARANGFAHPTAPADRFHAKAQSTFVKRFPGNFKVKQTKIQKVLFSLLILLRKAL
jgi:hypothetical protein